MCLYSACILLEVLTAGAVHAALGFTIWMSFTDLQYVTDGWAIVTDRLSLTHDEDGVFSFIVRGLSMRRKSFDSW